MRNRETLALLLACASAFGIANAQGGDESTDEGANAGTEQQGDRPEMRPRGARLSDEQRQAMRERWKNMSDEERAAARERMRKHNRNNGQKDGQTRKAENTGES